MNERTHRIPASSALTEQQLDGLACVVCGTVFAAGTRSVPVGETDGAQVFACASHGDDEPCAACGEPVDWSAEPHEFIRPDGSSALVCADCCAVIAENTTTGDQEGDATSGKSATWPDGEPKSVRDLERARRMVERVASLAADLRTGGVDSAAELFEVARDAWWTVVAAMGTGDAEAIDEAMEAAVDAVDVGTEELNRCYEAIMSE